MFVHTEDQCLHLTMVHIITGVLNSSCQDLHAPYNLQIAKHFCLFLHNIANSMQLKQGLLL